MVNVFSTLWMGKGKHERGRAACKHTPGRIKAKVQKSFSKVQWDFSNHKYLFVLKPKKPVWFPRLHAHHVILLQCITHLTIQMLHPDVTSLSLRTRGGQTNSPVSPRTHGHFCRNWRTNFLNFSLFHYCSTVTSQLRMSKSQDLFNSRV